MTHRTNIAVLLNAGAKALADSNLSARIGDEFARRGAQTRIHLVRDASTIAATTRTALGEGPDTVVAGGGDGTISAVAGVLAGTGVPMGVLPLGTFDHFAKDAGIPTRLDAAIRTVCDGRVVDVDVGRVNGRVFVNNSSLGLYPRAVRKRDQIEHELGRGKWPAALSAAIWVLRRYPWFNVRISVGGEVFERRSPLVFIGNNRYDLEGLRFGSRERLDDGQLSVYVIRRTGRLGILALAARAAIGRLHDAPNFEALTASHIEIDTRKRNATVATDGEVERLAMPLMYQIAPRSLAVIVPDDASPSRA